MPRWLLSASTARESSAAARTRSLAHPDHWPPGVPLHRSTAAASPLARDSARRRQPRDPHNRPGSASGDERMRSPGPPPPALHGPATPSGTAGPEPLDVAVTLLLESSCGGIGAVLDHGRRDSRTGRRERFGTEIDETILFLPRNHGDIFDQYRCVRAPRQHGTCSTRGREPGLGRP
jgi:hypothetical protein